MFDWISPLVQAFEPGETMVLTGAQMEALEANGVRVYRSGAFEDVLRPGVYAVKVGDVQRAKEVLGYD